MRKVSPARARSDTVPVHSMFSRKDGRLGLHTDFHACAHDRNLWADVTEEMVEHVLDGPIEQVSEHEILLCGSVQCGWSGEKNLKETLQEKLRAAGIGPDRVRITPASCFGACRSGERGKYAHLLVRPDKILYRVAGDDGGAKDHDQSGEDRRRPHGHLTRRD